MADTRRITTLPQLSRSNARSIPPLARTGSQHFDLPRSIGNIPQIAKGSNELSSLEDVSLLSQPNYRPKKSIMDSDSEDEVAGNIAPLTPRRKKASRVEKESPPKRSNMVHLNAYGIPLSSVNSGSMTSLKQKSNSDISDRIRVCVRKRPLSKKELRQGQTDIAPVTGRRSVTILEPKVKVDLTKFVETHDFIFDEAFDGNFDLKAFIYSS